ncbi:MAG: hypothetical protein M3Q13_05590 [Pseudomonadota bacterium]|nr:hypothetical protein [Pseudomonadota bacterium]
MTAYPLIVAAHATFGVLALLTFWTAAFARKGSPLHRRLGQGYLLAMLGIIVTALPMAAHKFAQGQPVIAAFLAYLVVITATGVWGAWRAIRDKHDVVRFTGPVYAGFAWLCLLSGVGVLALGIKAGAPLLMGFSVIGLFTGQDMLRKRRNCARLAAQPRWWLVEHYTAMLGNGIATHIAFLAIGLPKLLPAVDGAAMHYLAWFGPLVVALVAKVAVDRRWKPKARAVTPVYAVASAAEQRSGA